MPHGPRLPHDELRARAAERINDGRLPCLQPERIFGGNGAGEPCALCGQIIEPHQVLYEVIVSSAPHALNLHLICYSVWQLECVSRLSGGSAEPDAASSSPA